MLNRPEHKRRSWVVAAAAGAALAVAVPPTASAQIPVFGVDAVNLSQPVLRTVQELLDLDAHRALEEEKRKAQVGNSVVGQIAASSQSTDQAASHNAEAAPVVAPPRLLAITGVGKQLTVMVDQAGRRAHFRTGQAEPVAGVDLGLRLQAVSQPCASFVDQSHDVVTYCLNRGTP